MGQDQNCWTGDLPQHLSVELQSTHTHKLTIHTLRKLTIRIIKEARNIHVSIIDWKSRYSELFTTPVRKKAVYLTARGNSTDAQYWRRVYLLYSSLTGSSWCGYIGNSHKQTVSLWGEAGTVHQWPQANTALHTALCLGTLRTTSKQHSSQIVENTINCEKPFISEM